MSNRIDKSLEITKLITENTQLRKEVEALRRDKEDRDRLYVALSKMAYLSLTHPHLWHPDADLALQATCYQPTPTTKPTEK